MKKGIWPAIAVALLTSLFAAPLMAQPVLRWCLDHFPGFHEFHGNNRQPVGPSVDMMQELARRADFRLHILGKTPSSRCLKQLADGEMDVMTNLLYSARQARQLTLIRFASRHPDRLYLAAHDVRPISQLTQLSHLSLVTVRNLGLHPAIQQFISTVPDQQKQQVSSTLTALQMVARRRVDGALLPPTQVRQLFSQQPELASQVREVKFHSDDIVPQDVYIGLSRQLQDPALEQRIRTALLEMKKDGTMQRIFADKIAD